ncbi:hypothetical protein ACOMHN_030059 [Nucella lapillus]
MSSLCKLFRCHDLPDSLIPLLPRTSPGSFHPGHHQGVFTQDIIRASSPRTSGRLYPGHQGVFSQDIRASLPRTSGRLHPGHQSVFTQDIRASLPRT